MGGLAPATQFIHSQIQEYRYWYERLPYTALDMALPTGEEDIIRSTNLATATNRTQMAWVSDLATTPTANVAIRTVLDGDRATLPTVLWPTGLIPIETESHRAYRAFDTLHLSWFNNNAAALTSPVQFNYYGAMKTLTTADKLLYGLTDRLTPEDRQYIKKFAMTDNLRPLTLHEGLDHVFRRAILQNVEVGATVNAVATPVTWTFTPRSGELLVWHTLAASIPSGSVGNFITLQVDRDTQEDHLSLLLDNTPGLQQPWHPWMVAVQQIQFAVSATTATSGVVVRFGYYRVKKTRLIQILLGLLHPSEMTAQDRHWQDQLTAGIII